MPPAADAPAEPTLAAPEPEPQPALKLDPAPPPTSVAGTPEPTPPVSAADALASDDPPVAAKEPAAGPDAPTAPVLSAEEIERRLAVSLRAIEFDGVTIAQFATFIADASGVPVTFDEQALAGAPSGRRTKISLKLEHTTAGAALRAAIDRAGLSFHFSDDGEIVIAPRKG
jgi:hypothetical protein